MSKLTRNSFIAAVDRCSRCPKTRVAVLFASTARCVFFADGMIDLVMSGDIPGAYLPYAQETQDQNLIAFSNGSSLCFLRHNGDGEDLLRLAALYDDILVEDGGKDDELDRFIDSFQVNHTGN